MTSINVQIQNSNRSSSLEGQLTSGYLEIVFKTFQRSTTNSRISSTKNSLIIRNTLCPQQSYKKSGVVACLKGCEKSLIEVYIRQYISDKITLFFKIIQAHLGNETSPRLVITQLQDRWCTKLLDQTVRTQKKYSRARDYRQQGIPPVYVMGYIQVTFKSAHVCDKMVEKIPSIHAYINLRYFVTIFVDVQTMVHNCWLKFLRIYVYHLS